MIDVIKNMKAAAGYVCMNEFNSRMIVRQEWLPSEGQSARRINAAKKAIVQLSDYLGPGIKVLAADSSDSLAGVESAGVSVITMRTLLLELYEGGSSESKEQILKLLAECDEISAAFRSIQRSKEKVHTRGTKLFELSF
jgi:hypothetical protein